MDKPTCFNCVHAVIDKGNEAAGIRAGLSKCRSTNTIIDVENYERTEEEFPEICGDFTPFPQ